jgi:NAD(P)H-flavin reductase
MDVEDPRLQVTTIHNVQPPGPAPRQDDGISDWSGVAAVLCGQKEMAGAVKELLGAKGVEQILTNF